jgi:hypothetical protein
MRSLWLLLVSALFLSGCATKPIEYYYGNYEKTYYHSKKDGTPSSVAKYKESLEDIIKTSREKGLRVPPGIYCEYGYLLAKTGNPDAERYFDLEITAYPESAQFVALVRSQLKQGQP